MTTAELLAREQRECVDCQRPFECAPLYKPRQCPTCLAVLAVTGRARAKTRRAAAMLAQDVSLGRLRHTQDPEIDAMTAISAALMALPVTARRRVAGWIYDRFAVQEQL